MTSRGYLAHSPAQQPTVKCSTCETDVELSSLAEHRCHVPSYGTWTANPSQHHYIADAAPVTQSHFTSEPAEIVPPAPYPQRTAPEYQRQRPTLPKIDSNLPGRPARGIGAKEAANIAHDLGLPSPVSAGGGRRSPRPNNLRKTSSPRIPLAPPSPELPVGQDCAFPPFPISKPKRANTEKAPKNPKPAIIHRADTHDTSASHSASSSTYSSSSGGFTRGRTSDNGWRPRSRQGATDEAPSPPSTAPTSPHISQDSVEKFDDLERATSRHTDAGEPTHPQVDRYESPMTESSHSRSDRPLEMENDTEHYNRYESREPNRQISWSSGTGAAPVTFDSILQPSDQPYNPSARALDREPSYKSKRPPPLDNPQSVAPEFQFAALNGRSPSTSSNTGLSRSLTNLFSRKRSQSVSSKKSSKLDINSPRMRALAPEPPPVPQRGYGEFGLAQDDQESYFSSRPSHLASPSFSNRDVVSPLSAADRAVALRGSASPISEIVSPLSVPDQTSAFLEQPLKEQSSPNQRQTGFDFEFGSSTNKDSSEGIVSIDHEIIGKPETTQPQPDLKRASIDSASDYGSVRSSQQSIELNLSPPVAPSLGNKISSALRDSSASFDMGHNYRSRNQDNYHNHNAETQGRLSPVRESVGPNEVHISPPADPSEASEAMLSDSVGSLSQSPSKRRAATPAGNKGTCRGCSTIIEAGQKSVSSKDGRLTGRYHKECFNCQTCRRPFATADFYIFEDHPYCGHHYHVMNNSLCTSCGNGIEGQYLETFDVGGNESKKFHPRCLTCTTCRTQLYGDYFEFQGRVYCERDAFRAANGPIRSPYDNAPSRPSPLVREYISSGDPGTKGRFPERRTTRLMMI